MNQRQEETDPERDENKDGGRGWRVRERGRGGSPQIPRKVEDRDPERKKTKSEKSREEWLEVEPRNSLLTLFSSFFIEV